MARSDLLKRLFAAYAAGDDSEFRVIAERIIQDEHRKQHSLLANDLRHALTRDRGRPGVDQVMGLRAIPKDRDDRPLLALSKPARELDDLVLDEKIRSLLDELVLENRSRALLTGFSLRPRRRMLFVGPSGTGKSMTAHALGSELSLPVATVSLAALTSSFLGETARNVESIVRFAEFTPCVLLFDEFDAIGTERSLGGDHGELRRVVATILQVFEQMDGESLLIATSNHARLLDAAAWRRFDEVIMFGSLSLEQVSRLLELRLRGAPKAISIAHWAVRFADSSPAEIEAAAMDALRRWALSGDRKLTDAHMRPAAARARARSEAVKLATEPRRVPTDGEIFP